MRTYLLIHSWAVSSPLHCRPAARPRAERVENNPDMHAALARLVNNEETRKQEKINQIPKRSSKQRAARFKNGPSTSEVHADG